MNNFFIKVRFQSFNKSRITYRAALEFLPYEFL